MRPKLILTAVFAVVLATAGLSAASAHDGPDPADRIAELEQQVAVRDELITDQEDLLNAYRCLLGADLELVPGGCGDETGSWRGLSNAQTELDACVTSAQSAAPQVRTDRATEYCNRALDCLWERTGRLEDALVSVIYDCAQEVLADFDLLNQEPIVRSDGAWAAYSSGMQVGVFTEAIEQEVPGPADNSRMYAYCDEYGAPGDWGFSLAVDWGILFTPTTDNGFFTMFFEFSDGYKLSVGAHSHPSGNRYSAMTLPAGLDPPDLAVTDLLARGDQTVTWVAQDRGGSQFRAEFDLTGAPVAIRSLLDYCDAKAA